MTMKLATSCQPFRRTRIIWGFVAAGFLLPGPMAHTTTFPPPAREFSPAEKLELAVSASSAIVLCKLEAVTDTLVPNPVTGDSYDLEIWLHARAGRWFRGRGQQDREAFRVAISSPVTPSNQRLKKLIAQGRSPDVVLFLYEFESSYVLNEHPDFPGGGLLVLDAASRGQTIMSIERTLQRLSLDSLVARADLGIVGRAPGRPHSCPHAEVNRVCFTVSVESVLFGTAPGPSVTVYCDTGYVPEEETALLLIRDPHGMYFPAGFNAGLMPLSRARLDGHRATKGEVMEAHRKAAIQRGPRR